MSCRYQLHAYEDSWTFLNIDQSEKESIEKENKNFEKEFSTVLNL